MSRIAPFTLLILAMLSAMPAWAKTEITTSGAWVRATPPGAKVTGAFMVITNEGDEADDLVSFSTKAATTCELHETKMHQGMMNMVPVPRIEIKPKASVELRPGSLHLMLIDLTRELKPGDKVDLTLEFRKAGKITIQADVRAMMGGGHGK